MTSKPFNLEIQMKNFEHNYSFKVACDEDFEVDQQIKKKAMEERALYEESTSRFFTEVIQPGDTVIDVGANVGWFTLLSAVATGPTGRVLSFEAAPANVRKLRANIELNGYKNVEVIPQPVSDVIKDTTFYINPEGSGGCALWDMCSEKEVKGEPLAIKTVTLDSLNLSKVKLIKVDTEGHDQRVLVGATKLLTTVRPEFVIAEMHEPGLNYFGDTQTSIRDFMRNFGYSTFMLLEGAPMPIYLPDATYIKTTYTVNFLFATLESVGKAYPAIKLGVDA